MHVKEVTSEKEWMDFIESVQPSTFLQSWQWGEFEKNLNRFVVRLGVYKEHKLIACALFSKIPARRGAFLLCPHGPVLQSEFLPELESIISALKTESVSIAKKQKCDFVRISTLILDSAQARESF